MTNGLVWALQRHNGGEMIAEADELLRKCVSDVTRYGQKAKLTITIEIKPEAGALKLSADVRAALPKREHGAAFYFAHPEDGSLTREPPKDDSFFKGPQSVEMTGRRD